VIDAEFPFFFTIYEVRDVILIHLRVELDWGIWPSRFPFEKPTLTFGTAAGRKIVCHSLASQTRSHSSKICVGVICKNSNPGAGKT
jgi:hypothetical protein